MFSPAGSVVARRQSLTPKKLGFGGGGGGGARRRKLDDDGKEEGGREGGREGVGSCFLLPTEFYY